MLIPDKPDGFLQEPREPNRLHHEPDTLASDFDAVESLSLPAVDVRLTTLAKNSAGPPAGLISSNPVYIPPALENLSARDTDEYYAGLAAEAMAYMQAANYAAAIPVLRELHNEYPGDINAVRELGRAHYMADPPAGSNRMALFYLKKARRLSPDDTETLKTLGLALYKAEELEKALEVINRYIELKPDDQHMERFYSKILRENSAQDGFMLESSDHFDVYYDSSKYRGLGYHVLSLLDDAYRRMSTELRLYSDQPVSIILYSTRSFRDATLGPDWTGGIYDGKIRLPIRGLDENDPGLAKVLAHEYSHAVVHSFTHKCPSWLNEGLAMYLEGRPTQQVRLVADLRDLEGSFMSLNAAQAQVAYSVSFSAVSFLIEKYGIYRIKYILEAMKSGSPFQRAFNESMPVDYSEFIRQWNESQG